VIGTFLTVAFLTLKNRTIQRLRRLREPRYLIGAIAGAAYFWFFIFRRSMAAHNSSSNPKLIIMKTLSVSPVVADCAAVVLLLLMITAWALPADSGGLEFTETEIAFLFPAPLRRRDILLYKIVRAQPQALFSALIMTVLGWWRNGLFIGVWSAISVLGVYFTLVSLGRARLRLMHVGFLARLAGVAAIVAGLVWIAKSELSTINFRTLKNAPQVMNALSVPFHKPLIRTILFIPRLIASAAIPPSFAMLAISVPIVLALGVGFFFVAAGLNVSFEEASIAASQKKANRQQRVQGQRAGTFVMFRRAPAPFKLGETGPIETAVVWKNMIALVRNSIAWVVVFAAVLAFMLGVALWSRETTAYTAIGSMLMFMSCFFPLMGPNVFSNDLRLDMPRLEVLKSYPITGERLIAAEIASPLLVISILEMLFATSASIMMGLGNANKLTKFIATPQFIVAVLLLTIPICAVQLVIRNSIPVLFPAWAMRSKDEPRGFVAMGQRIVTLAGNLIVLAVALIPAAIVFLPSIWLAFKFFAGNPAFVAVATMPAVAVLLTEVWMGIKALGAQFEKLDITNESDMSAP